jgi:small subunit ribosomal protein S2
MTKPKINISIEEMKKAGVFFGHKAFKCHPKMKQYVLGVRGSDHINIIDLEKTAQSLKEAIECITKLIEEKKVILIVGTGPGITQMIKEFGTDCKLPYVENRWIGGTISNFEFIKKRIDHLKDLEKKKQTGELEKYTKKERLGFDKEIDDLNKKFGGIKTLEKFPDALLIVDIEKENIAVKEARAKNIPIVAIVDTNTDPSVIDYPIPANDDAPSSVKYILDKIKEACK